MNLIHSREKGYVFKLPILTLCYPATTFYRLATPTCFVITPCPELLTEEELIVFLRIPKISKSQDYHNVIENLKRMHDLPRIHICGKLL
jgi:hypothetical protein